MTTLKPVSAIVAELITGAVSGGATVTAVAHGAVPRAGYVVAIPEHNVTVSQDRFGDRSAVKIGDDDESIATSDLRAIESFVRANRARLAQTNRYAGVWRHGLTGDLHLDVVEVFAERLPAIVAGRVRREHAIYDLSTGDDIRTDGFNYGAPDSILDDAVGIADDNAKGI